MRGADEIIISALKEGPKTPKELWQACSKLGLKKDRYRRHRIQLIKDKVIEEAKYKYVGEREADSELIRDCMHIIQSDNPEAIRVARAQQIEQLCKWNRTVSVTKLLQFLKGSINDQNEQVRKHLVSALANILRYEQKRTPRDQRIIHRIVDENLENMRTLASEDNNFEVRVAVLKFLGYTGDIRALDPIFKIIKKCNQNEYGRLKEWIQWVLFTPEYLLAKKLNREVSKRLDQLLIDPDEQVKKRAEELHRFMLSPNGMQ